MVTHQKQQQSSRRWYCSAARCH